MADYDDNLICVICVSLVSERHDERLNYCFTNHSIAVCCCGIYRAIFFFVSVMQNVVDLINCCDSDIINYVIYLNHAIYIKGNAHISVSEHPFKVTVSYVDFMVFNVY